MCSQGIFELNFKGKFLKLNSVLKIQSLFVQSIAVAQSNPNPSQICD